MEARKIIITDTHFGVKNNSVKFLESQKKIFSQLRKYIKYLPNEESRFDLIHLGDIFESRSTLSVQIMSEVKEQLQILYSIITSKNNANRMIFVAGNHDFYSPTSDNINTLDTFIKEILPEAIIVDKYCWRDGDDLYVPWYQMNDPEKFEIKNKINTWDGVKRIFTHCDCHDFAYNKIPQGITMYSGHIHQYHEYKNVLSDIDSEKSFYFNLSTPYSLDFGDSNDDKKGFWTLDGLDLKLHQNDESIKFKTFINEQIFNIPDLDDSIERGDNFRIYITEENRTKLEYIERLNELSSSLKYVNIILTSGERIITEASSIDNLNITEILSEMIPAHLQDEYKIIKDEIENESNGR